MHTLQYCTCTVPKSCILVALHLLFMPPLCISRGCLLLLIHNAFAPWYLQCNSYCAKDSGCLRAQDKGHQEPEPQKLMQA